MRIELAQDGVCLLRGVPEPVALAVQAWFGDGRVPSRLDPDAADRRMLSIDPRRLLAFRAYNPSVEVADQIETAIARMRQKMPDGIRQHLHSHPRFGDLQARILAKAMQSRHHIVAADAGLGKTACVIEEAQLGAPAIIVVPTMIWRNSYREDARWFDSGMNIVATHGANPIARSNMLRQRADIYAVSPSCLQTSLPDLMHLPAGTVIVDESDPFANHASERTKALREITRDRDTVTIYTADPCPNHLGELYSLANIVAPGKLGRTYGDFAAEYGGGTVAGRVTFSDFDKAKKALDEIRSHVTMVPAERFWHDRPELFMQRVEIELGPREREAYDALRVQRQLKLEPTGAKLEGDVLDGDGIGGYQRLREVTAGFVYDKRHQPRFLGEGTKVRHVVRFAKEVGEPIVVWCQFKAEQSLLVDKLTRAGLRCASITGSNRASYDALQQFTAGRADVLLSNPQSAAHGIRLHRARYCLFTGTPRYSFVYQAIRRLYRYPQTQDVVALFLVAMHTQDERDYANMLDEYGWNQQYREALTGGVAA